MYFNVLYFDVIYFDVMYFDVMYFDVMYCILLYSTIAPTRECRISRDAHCGILHLDLKSEKKKKCFTILNNLPGLTRMSWAWE